jgi:hypothetical protein
VKSRKIAVAAATAAFLAHLFANTGYGFFRDELYFIICGRHPAFGYVDQPPLVPLLTAGTQIIGTSLMALHALAALCSALSIFVTVRIVQEFEGKTFSQVFAAIVAFFTPVLMAFGEKVATDTIGLWLWPLAVLYIIRIVKGGDARNWMWAGAAIGFAGEAKYSVLFFAAALCAGILLSPQRAILRSRWCAAGAAIAALIMMPNFFWQAVHGFPMLELLRNGQMGKNVMLTPVQYLLQQVFLLNPLLIAVPLIGLAWLALRAQWRWMAYTFVILMAAMIVLHGKDYYPADVYPYLIAAGAIPVERWTQRFAAVLQPAIVILAIAAGAWMVPFVLPVLSEPQLVAYRQAVGRALGVKPIAGEHHRTQPALGQDFADMHGWPQLAQTVAKVYLALPPGARARAVIKASNYGEAAAIDFFGGKYALPPAISGHNQYYLWGTHRYTGDVLIDVNGDCGGASHFFRHSVRAATFHAPYVMDYEDNIPIMVCRGIKAPLSTIWFSQKDYI